VLAGEEIRVLAWSGPSEPRDARSHIVVPIPASTVGQLRVESDLPDAFGAEDRRLLQECAALLRPLWG